MGGCRSVGVSGMCGCVCCSCIHLLSKLERLRRGCSRRGWTLKGSSSGVVYGTSFIFGGKRPDGPRGEVNNKTYKKIMTETLYVDFEILFDALPDEE